MHLMEIRVAHVDSRCGAGVTVEVMAVEFLIIKTGQNMVLPVAQRDRFRYLVVNVETFQIFIGGIGKAVQHPDRVCAIAG